MKPSKRNLILSVDDSEGSQHACEWMCDNLLRAGDEVHFFHVIEPPHADVMGGVSGVSEVMAEPPDLQQDRATVDQATNFIRNEFASKLHGHQFKIEVVRYHASAISVAEALCQRARDLDAAAVVIASHNKTALKRWFLGSSSSYVAEHCPTPLVILH